MSKEDKNKNEGIKDDYHDRLNDLTKDLAPIKDKKRELIYEYEVLDDSDNSLDNIKNTFSKNSSTSIDHKGATHQNDAKVDIGKQFINGDHSGALLNISQVINKSWQLKLEEIVTIKNKMDEMIKNPAKEQLKDGCDYIIDITEISNKNTKDQTIERKNFLESIKKLFTATKEGFEKGFDKVENAINFLFEKVKSLGKDKITVITDKGNTR